MSAPEYRVSRETYRRILDVAAARARQLREAADARKAAADQLERDLHAYFDRLDAGGGEA